MADDPTVDLRVKFRQEIKDDLERENDRGMVLTGAAYLDEALDVLLRAVFVDDKGPRGLLHETGALGSFGAKINLAYGLGLLRQDMYDDLHTIRKVRNSFAHTFETCSFDSPLVSAELSKLHTAAFKGWSPGEIGMRTLLARTVSEHSEDILIMAERAIRAVPGEGFQLREIHIAVLDWFSRLDERMNR